MFDQPRETMLPKPIRVVWSVFGPLYSLPMSLDEQRKVSVPPIVRESWYGWLLDGNTTTSLRINIEIEFP